MNMAQAKVEQLISRIRAFGAESRQVYHREILTELRLGCRIREPVPWDRETVEQTLEVTLPDELIELWRQCSGLDLFVDFESSLWGLDIHSPVKVIERHLRRKSWRGIDYERGDLILGEFVGDADTLVLRCDPNKNDFRNVLIGLEIDVRKDWPCVGLTLLEFMGKFIDESGDKFWES